MPLASLTRSSLPASIWPPALLAARSVNSTLAGLADEERAFAEFEDRYRHEYGLFYEFLMSFYDMSVDDSSYYWQAKKVTRTENSELEAFVELVDGVASRDVTFVEPDSLRKRFQQTSVELAESVSEVNRLAGDDATELYQSSILGNVLERSAAVQVRAQLGGDAGAEDPLLRTACCHRQTACTG